MIPRIAWNRNFTGVVPNNRTLKGLIPGNLQPAFFWRFPIWFSNTEDGKISRDFPKLWKLMRSKWCFGACEVLFERTEQQPQNSSKNNRKKRPKWENHHDRFPSWQFPETGYRHQLHISQPIVTIKQEHPDRCAAEAQTPQDTGSLKKATSKLLTNFVLIGGGKSCARGCPTILAFINSPSDALWLQHFPAAATKRSSVKIESLSS